MVSGPQDVGAVSPWVHVASKPCSSDLLLDHEALVPCKAL